MSARFVVLASGSAGNASLICAEGFGLLIDCGIGRRTLAGRLARRGLTWRHIHAVVLTHTHTDHWHETSFGAILEHRIPLYCHPEHANQLNRMSRSFSNIVADKLVQSYDAGVWLALESLRLLPLEVPHDGEPAFGFRLEGPGGLFGPDWALGYAADLGTWRDDLARKLADVDLLAVEFNHDEAMQRTSGRPRQLIERVLGDRGHLSNRQAGGFIQAVQAESATIDMRFVVTLHRSRECNRPELVESAALEALGDRVGRVEVHVAEQDVPTAVLHLSRKLPPPPRPRRKRIGIGPSPGFFNGAN